MTGYLSLVEVILGLVAFYLVANHFSKLISANKRPERWEYLIDGMGLGEDVARSQEHFNELGMEGWEATSSWLEPAEGSQSEKGLALILFKRPVD